MNKTLYWVPRVFGILLLIFISLFALDVFGPNFSWLALLMHLIPSLILLVVLVISWKWSKVGGVLWILLGVYYVVMTRAQEHIVTYLVMTLPAIVVGILFMVARNDSGQEIQSQATPHMTPTQDQAQSETNNTPQPPEQN